jgi:hypothetical protein
MRSLPVDSSAFRAPVKISLLREDEVRYFSLCLFPWNRIDCVITEETSGVKFFLVEREGSFLNYLLQLARRVILRDGDDTIFGSSESQFRIPGQEDSFFLTGQMDELMNILPPVIEGIVTKHPQPFGQLP